MQTLVQVRNPWSTENYVGPWSDKSDMWTDDYKSQVNYVNANDGKFYMPAKLFFSTFRGVSVAIYEKGLTHSTIKYR